MFLVTLLFFLAGQMEFRRYVASFIGGRDAKLRFIRIANDIEHNLASYVATVTVINVCLGVVVAVGAWLFGFPSPMIFGILAMVLNYIPYIGPGCMALILFAVGLVTFPSLGYALVAAGGVRGLDHDRRAYPDAGRARAPAHAQSARGLAGARVLDLDVGSDGRFSGGSAHPHRGW